MAEKDETFIDFMTETKVPIEELDFIVNNPEGLTAEGVKFNINQWKKDSHNKYVVKKYEYMLIKCKNFSKSGKLSDGKTILSRDKDDEVTWAEMIDDKFNLVKQLEVVK